MKQPTVKPLMQIIVTEHPLDDPFSSTMWWGKSIEEDQKCDKCGEPVRYLPNLGLCEACKPAFINELKRLRQ